VRTQRLAERQIVQDTVHCVFLEARSFVQSGLNEVRPTRCGGIHGPPPAALTEPSRFHDFALKIPATDFPELMRMPGGIEWWDIVSLPGKATLSASSISTVPKRQKLH
jgi:hypothetical protein